MKRKIRFLIIALLFSTLALLLPVTAYANSAEPPSIIFLINNPPDDLSISMILEHSQMKATVRHVAWEGYYSFYSRHIRINGDGDYRFNVTSSDGSFEFTLGQPLKGYNNIYTLDLTSHKTAYGTNPLRSVLLVSMRILFTFVIEGFIFWLFGFRKKSSWAVFFIINLATQGALNIWLNSEASLMSSYLIFGLIFGEFFVFLTEMIVFPFVIKEHRRRRSFFYAFIANLISLIAGGYMISLLPV